MNSICVCVLNLPEASFFLTKKDPTCVCRHHTCVWEQEGSFHQAETTQSSGVHPAGAVLEAGQ